MECLNCKREMMNHFVQARGSEISATFDSTQGTVSGSAGCNRYSGGYRVRGSRMSIGRLTHTEMACRQPDGQLPSAQSQVQEALHPGHPGSVQSHPPATSARNLPGAGRLVSPPVST